MKDFKSIKPKMTTRELDGTLTMYVILGLVVLMLVLVFAPLAVQFFHTMSGNTMQKITARTLAHVLTGHEVVSVKHCDDPQAAGKFDVYTLTNGCVVVDWFDADEPGVEIYADVGELEAGLPPSETFAPDEY